MAAVGMEHRMVKCPVADKAEMDYRWSLWPSLNTLKDSEEEYQKRNSEEEYRFRILYISLVLYVQTALSRPLHGAKSQDTWTRGSRLVGVGDQMHSTRTKDTDTGPDSDFPRKDSALSCLLEPSLDSTSPSLSFPAFFFFFFALFTFYQTEISEA